jgi:DNA (cytosine-5)-methyltransferase 1
VIRPLLLDLFCGAGGAAVGYHRAGFDVIGVDIDPQPDYPYKFIQADALSSYAWAAAEWRDCAAVHASPPCQHYSDLAHRNGNADEWPDLVDQTRNVLQRSGLPYVIENVEGAPLIDPVTLCGTMFPELAVIRHRLFEANWPLTAPAEHPRHPLVFTHDKRKAHYGRLDQDTSYVQVTGGGNATLANKRRAMGMPWANNHGLNEAIPPAYTEFIGRQLIDRIAQTAA